MCVAGSTGAAHRREAVRIVERIGYGRTAQTARDYGVSRKVADCARHYAMSGHDGTGRLLYDEARFELAVRWARRNGTFRGLPGYVGPLAG